MKKSVFLERASGVRRLPLFEPDLSIATLLRMSGSILQAIVYPKWLSNSAGLSDAV